MDNPEVNRENKKRPSEMTTDSYELERKSIFDKIVKPIGFALFLVFCSAGILSIIYRYSYILDIHEIASSYEKHIFEGKYAVILGFHYLGLSAFFLVKTLLRDELDEKQKRIKKSAITLSLSISLITFIIVGLQVGILFAITKPIITSIFALIIYGMYKGIIKYI